MVLATDKERPDLSSIPNVPMERCRMTNGFNQQFPGAPCQETHAGSFSVAGSGQRSAK